MDCNSSPSDARRALAFLADIDALPSTSSGHAEGGGGGHTARAGDRYQLQALHARGGIGQVWQASDRQLGRVVALKELRPENQDHAGLRRRFLMEAQITGQLNHPGIVPVHELVSPANGETPYYTMRFVEGQTLTQAAREYHQKREEGRAGAVELRDLLQAFVSVCNTLAYAHARGVVHRDLKGANIILGNFGEVLVLDWGIAKVFGTKDERIKEPPVQLDTVVEVIATGAAVLGTPAYMAPEQAEGQTERIDQRTDVFGLGAVLYEILTSGSPYVGSTIQELLTKAKEGKPAPPRSVAAWVPGALQAVCLKALAMRPEDRYATAEELADEMKRWLSGEPVGAWAEPWRLRAGRWVRRHRVLSAATAAALLMAVVLGSAAGVYRDQQRARAREYALAGMRQAAELRQRYQWRDAEEMLQQVSAWVQEAGGGELRDRLGQAESDLGLARDLDRIRLEAATLVGGKWQPGRVSEEYQRLLAAHGLNVLGDDLDQLSERISAFAVRDHIIAALETWARLESSVGRWRRLLELANRADEPDAWRQAVRRALVARDMEQLLGLTRRVEGGKPTPSCALLLAAAFPNAREEATLLLLRMQEDHPGEFWINFSLGARLDAQRKHQEAAASYSVAAALRPDSGPVYYNLGKALSATGDVEGAIRSYRKAIVLDPTNARAFNNLGVAWNAKGDLESAIRSYRSALALDPNDALAHYNLGNALLDKGDIDGAIYSIRKALALNPKLGHAHDILGKAFLNKGDPDGAMPSLRLAIAFAPKDALPHVHLGNAWLAKGEWDLASRCYHNALALDPKNPLAHCNLGVVLGLNGDREGAIRYYEKAISLNGKFALAHGNLGFALQAKGRVVEAIACYEQALALDPKDAAVQSALSQALLSEGRFGEGVVSCRRALELLPNGHRLRDPVSRLLEQCQRGLILEDKLTEVLSGQVSSADAHESVALALLALRPFKRLYSASARLWQEAFTANPILAENLRAQHRYNAACAAALAAAGQGKDADHLDDEGRTRCRRQALEWLRADLALWTKQIDYGLHTNRTAGQKTLQHWAKDTDLASVRDKDALAKLPEAERADWQKLWAEVERLLAATKAAP